MTATDTEALKERVCTAIDDRANDIVSLAESVQAEPELGYKEEKTTEKLADCFAEMDLDVETGLAVTGARARAGSGEFVAAVLGELDALVNNEHPLADSETGAVHACGHHAQLAHLAAVGYAFTETGVLNNLDGALELIAVPAEEYLDLEYRRGLINDGEIEFLGGKQELIRRGYFADVDCAAMVHAADETPGHEITTDFSTNGFVGKFITYEGKESHAGSAPEEGVNALNAATLGLNAVHTQRETFADEDHVRVHPIITKGGDGVNVVPADVRAESYVRAKDISAITDANTTVNRALESGAMAVGANVTIEDYPGYMPLQTDRTLVNHYNDNVQRVLGDDALVAERSHLTGSTDMGDVTQIVPGIHPWIGGFEGNVHARDFEVADTEMAYLLPAKVTACTLVDVFTDPEAREAIREAKDEKLSRETYLEQTRELRETISGEYLD
ncbi:amidohydrolase [Halococcus thailandensis]|uniref:Peptidase M20 domain-containing protein 2 n=1 Tax=Halococcus thailandensis JCM 13552 TaxID=1227457 RepID=M0NFC1_9EURY|nr:amidohydrolase [Halococcus thailandensis]EMA56672.1 AmiB [Halococcus thailandensis JCM 13552]